VSRFLFVFPPFVGHVGPALGVAEVLAERGHEVAWVAHEAAVGGVLRDAHVYPAGDEFFDHIAEHLPERDRLKGLSAVRFLWEKVLVPLARTMVGPVRSAVDDFGPDVVLADQQAFAGAIVAVERGLPWGSSAGGTAELMDPALVAAPAVAVLDARAGRDGHPRRALGGLRGAEPARLGRGHAVPVGVARPPRPPRPRHHGHAQRRHGGPLPRQRHAGPRRQGL